MGEDKPDVATTTTTTTTEKTKERTTEKMRIAVHPMDSAGHLNPMLALCTKMMERGHFLRFFLNSDKNEKNLERSPFKGNFDMVRVYEDGGEQVSKENMMNGLLPHQDQTESDQKVSDILVGMLVQSSKQIPAVLEKVKEFKPDLIVYDPFMLDAMVVAYLLNIPPHQQSRIRVSTTLLFSLAKARSLKRGRSWR